MKTIFFDVDDKEKLFFENYKKDENFQLITNSLNSLEKISPSIQNAEIISTFTTSRIDKEVLEQFKNLKLIALRSVGFNHVDLDYCKQHNIIVENSPNYGNITVAEFAFGLLLDVCRKITLSNEAYKENEVYPKLLIGNELFGKTVGIVGLGAIGSEFARIANGIGMKILAFDKFEKDEIKEKYNVTYTSFEELLKNSDYISIHAPYTKENYHMFNRDSFKLMKKTAIIINTGRGELIDNEALFEALYNKEIQGAGLDVLEYEETLTDENYIIGINKLDKIALQKTIVNSRLIKLDNIVITPHIAYNTEEAILRILNITIDNINKFKQGIIQNSVY